MPEAAHSAGPFGTACVATSPQARIQAKRRNTLIEAIGDERLTIQELLSRLVGWTKADVLAELRELTHEGRIRTGESPGGRQYWLVEPDEEEAPPAPLPPVTQAERTAPALSAPRTPVAGNTLSEPAALPERLMAIRDDLEDVLTDAIRGLAEEKLLLQLLAAQLAIERSLRQLELRHAHHHQ